MLMVQIVREGMSAGEVAEQFGVSRRTVCKWLARFRTGGEAALTNRSSKTEVVRYEHEALGDMTSLDIKKTGRADGVGHLVLFS